MVYSMTLLCCLNVFLGTPFNDANRPLEEYKLTKMVILTKIVCAEEEQEI